LIDHGFHLTVTNVLGHPREAADRFRWFVSEGVTSVRLYLAYPERLMVDEPTLRRAMAARDEAGVHAEDGLEAVRLTADVLAAGEPGPAGRLRSSHTAAVNDWLASTPGSNRAKQPSCRRAPGRRAHATGTRLRAPRDALRHALEFPG
jgi:hypothetical protein